MTKQQLQTTANTVAVQYDCIYEQFCGEKNPVDKRATAKTLFDLTAFLLEARAQGVKAQGIYSLDTVMVDLMAWQCGVDVKMILEVFREPK